MSDLQPDPTPSSSPTAARAFTDLELQMLRGDHDGTKPDCIECYWLNTLDAAQTRASQAEQKRERTAYLLLVMGEDLAAERQARAAAEAERDEARRKMPYVTMENAIRRAERAEAALATERERLLRLTVYHGCAIDAYDPPCDSCVEISDLAEEIDRERKSSQAAPHEPPKDLGWSALVPPLSETEARHRRHQLSPPIILEPDDEVAPHEPPQKGEG